MSLRLRMALLFALGVAALVLASGAVLLQELDNGLDNALDMSLTARADALAQQVAPDGTVANFQDSGGGADALLPPTETLAEVISPSGALTEASEGTGGRPLLSPAELARARRGRVAVTKALGIGEVRLLALPVPDSGSPSAVVVVGTTREVSAVATARVRTAVVVGGPVAAALGGLGAWLVAGAVLRPVERMRAQAAEISAGDSTARLPVPARRDEIAKLGETVNGLLARLQEALTKQRRFVADAGHELRTPLTVLRAELELAARPDRSKGSLLAAVRSAAAETDRLIRLAEDLLRLAQMDDAQFPLKREPLALESVVQGAVDARVATANSRGVAFATDLAHTRVAGDRDRLRQVIDNLLDNAVRHSPDNGTVTVTLTSAPDSPGVVTLSVADQGPGFPSDFLARAFDRFTRGDEARSDDEGTGLGLAIAASLAAAHDGTVSAANRPEGGAVVRVELPTL
jgi:hypothetical protein